MFGTSRFGTSMSLRSAAGGGAVRCLFGTSWTMPAAARLGNAACVLKGIQHGPLDHDGGLAGAVKLEPCASKCSRYEHPSTTREAHTFCLLFARFCGDDHAAAA